MRRAFMTIVTMSVEDSRALQEALETEQEQGTAAEDVDRDAVAASIEGDTGTNTAAETGREEASDDTGEPDEDDEEETRSPIALRPRVILEADTAPSIQAMVDQARLDGGDVRSIFDGLVAPADGPGIAQRLEMVISDLPVPEAMLGAAAWGLEPTAAMLDLYTVVEPQQLVEEGGVRSVFELRPDGARERIIQGYGLTPIIDLDLAEPGVIPDGPATGWTLWWRPLYIEEAQQRELGFVFDPDDRPDLLLEAVPLMRGLTKARWTFTAISDEEDNATAARYTQFRTLTVEDVPGYVEFELETNTGVYANWMFEVVAAPAYEFEVDAEDALAAGGTQNAANGEGGDAVAGATGGAGGALGGSGVRIQGGSNGQPLSIDIQDPRARTASPGNANRSTGELTEGGR